MLGSEKSVPEGELGLVGRLELVGISSGFSFKGI